MRLSIAEQRRDRGDKPFLFFCNGDYIEKRRKGFIVLFYETYS